MYDMMQLRRDYSVAFMPQDLVLVIQLRDRRLMNKKLVS